MTFEKLRLRNIGVFQGEHEFDFTLYAGPLIAVTGENGSGKTTMLELLLGALRRRCPTRGSLASLATARDSFVEVTVVVGACRYVVRQLIDGISGKGECVIMTGDGVAVIDSAKVRAGDDFIEKHFPPEQVLLASVFSCQGSSGFLGAKPSDRKDILLQLLGPEMERLEAYAVEARERVKATKAEFATVQARIADELRRLPEVPSAGGSADQAAQAGAATSFVNTALMGLTEQLAGCRLEADGARDKAARLGALLDDLKVEALRLEAAAEQARQLEARRADATAAHAAAAEALRVLEIRISKNRGVNEQAAQIRAAVVEDAELVAQQASDDAELTRIETAHTAAMRDAHVHDQAREQAGQRLAEERARCDRLTAALEQAAQIERAEAERPAANELADSAAEFVTLAEAELKELTGKQLGGAYGRITALRGGLETIALDKPADPAAVALATCHADEETDLAEKAVPAKIKSLEAKVAERKTASRRATEAAQRLNELAARVGEVQANRTALAEATAAAERWKAEEAAGSTRYANAQQRASEVSQPGTALTAARGPRQARREALAGWVKLAKPLAEAEAKLAEIVPLAEQGRAEVERLQLALAGLPEAQALPPAPDVDGAAREASSARQAADDAAKRLGQAEQRLDLAKASSERLALLDVDRQTAEAELADWTRLAADLGKDGLQAMVIDGAIPELNTITNDLLQSAFGPRWTIDVRTQSADAKGKRLLETLDVWFIDTERGREGLAETLSGGEKTIVAEALSLALTAIACRQARAERPTLIRDESAGQLSPGKTRAWIEMMRRAADIIGVDRILFVNHNPETWELADARIEVKSAA